MTLVTSSRIDVPSLERSVSSKKHGALATFVGSVRSPHAGRVVTSVSYDCFTPLAECALSRIVRSAETRWPVRVAVRHRIGRLRVGAASVAVSVGSGHRAEAFEACRFVIDEIKRVVPVWKKEHYASGSGRWLPGCALQRRRA